MLYMYIYIRVILFACYIYIIRCVSSAVDNAAVEHYRITLIIIYYVIDYIMQYK